MISPVPTRGPVAVIAGLLLLLTVATYFPVRHFEYVLLDDPAYVTENLQVLRGVTAEGIQWAFTTGHAANWHPVTWLSHMLDVSLFGVDAGAHHLVNLAIHSVSAVLLFLVLTHLTAAPWRSGFVAAVFALHPLHVESVAWVAERKDVLAAFFWMTTMAAYARYVAAPSRMRMGVVALSLAVGLMCKPMLVTLPFALLLLDRWPLNRWSRWQPAALLPLVKEKALLFLLAVLSSVVTVIVQRQGGALNSLEVLPVSLRLANAVVSLTRYLQKTFWPADLSVLYSLPDTVHAGPVFGASLVLLAVTIIAIRTARRRPALLVGWLWFLGTLIPVLGLVQVGVQGMADRYTYIPMIGLSLMVAWLPAPDIARSVIRRSVMAAAAMGVVAAMVIATRQQLPVWKDDASLWTNATMHRLGVDEFSAHMSLGATLAQQQRLAGALSHYTAAAALRPTDVNARRGIGLTHLNAGRISDAIQALEAAAALAPDDIDVLNDLGIAYVRARRIDDAIRQFERLVQLRPSDARFHQALAALRRGR
jgi:hypothetical protein